MVLTLTRLERGNLLHEGVSGLMFVKHRGGVLLARETVGFAEDT